jgi:hypothetical protein
MQNDGKNIALEKIVLEPHYLHFDRLCSFKVYFSVRDFLLFLYHGAK